MPFVFNPETGEDEWQDEEELPAPPQSELPPPTIPVGQTQYFNEYQPPAPADLPEPPKPANIAPPALVAPAAAPAGQLPEDYGSLTPDQQEGARQTARGGADPEAGYFDNGKWVLKTTADTTAPQPRPSSPWR